MIDTADTYWHRRLVSWLAYHCSRGADRAAVSRLNAARKAPFKEEDIGRLWSEGQQACRNAEIISAVMELVQFERIREAAGQAYPHQLGAVRICDVTGCKFPGR